MSFLRRLFGLEPAQATLTAPTTQTPPAAQTPPAPLPEAPAGQPAHVPNLTAMLRAVGFKDVNEWASALAAPMAAAGITTRLRMAAFLANCAHETGGGVRLTENLRYSAKRLTEVWPSRFPTIQAALPYAWDPTDEDAEDVALANLTYGSRMGNQRNGTNDDDGWKYRGRGLIQITGFDNYAAIGMEATPEWLSTREGAAMSACRYWSINGLNATADTGDIRAVRRRVNGGYIGVDDVEKRYALALRA